MLPTFTTGDERIYSNPRNGMWVRLRGGNGHNLFTPGTNDDTLWRKLQSLDWRDKVGAQADLDAFAKQEGLTLVTADEYYNRRR